MDRTTSVRRISLHKVLVVAVLAVMMLAGCKPQVPSEYIQPDDMADILYDYYVMKSLASQGDNSEYNRSLYYLGVLKKHSVSEAEFDSSLVYYYAHAERLAKVYETVSKRLQSEATKLGASVGEIGKYANLTAKGDTANIWKDATCAILMPAPPYNRIDFTIKADSTFKRGDSFMLNIMANFMFQSGNKDGIICAKVSYAGSDSTAVYYANVNVSGLAKLQIPGNDDADIKEIEGFFYLGQGGDESYTRKILFIDGIQLIRFHRKKEVAAQPNDSTTVGTAATAPVPAQPKGGADTVKKAAPDVKKVMPDIKKMKVFEPTKR